MRFPAAASPRLLFSAAALAAVFALPGCASHEPLKPATAASGEAASVQADAATAAASANAGVQQKAPTRLEKFLWIFSPYRPDIQQGNFVSKEMLTQLKVGQTMDQVRQELGNPLLTDIFHGQRWDYPFRFERGNGTLTTARVTVYFDKDGKVTKWDGGNLPTEREYIAEIAGPIRQVEKPALPLDIKPATAPTATHQ